ncbi:MAG: hypothetical protein ACTHOU_18770 [Aureliella sp.]
MARKTDYPSYYGAAFPAEEKTQAGEQYGPSGNDYTGSASLIAAPSAAGLAVVRFVVKDSAGQPIENAVVRVGIEEPNETIDGALIARGERVVHTDANGIADVEMVHLASFVVGGTYHIKVSDADGRRSHDRKVTVPSLASVYAEDLPDA